VYTDFHTLCVSLDCTIRDAIARLDTSRLGVVLVVDGERHLQGTVTDGDVRRAVLAGTDFGEPVSVLLERKAGTSYGRPITAPVDAGRETYLALFHKHRIFHLPLLDTHQRVAGLTTLDEFLPEQPLPLQAVLMAGGTGTRLRPLTNETPKPMLTVGDRPLMEIIISQLRDAGITRVNVTTHYKHEKIVEHFGDGSDFGVQLSYLPEERPLGTAGALGLLEKTNDTLLVINGDILTDLDFRALLAYHKEQRAELTVAVKQYDIEVPYGIIECDGSLVRRVREKPVLKFLVNAGIYVVEPSALDVSPKNGEHFDMTDLIQRLVEAGRTVVSFPVREYWLDIGQPSDYTQAQKDIEQWKQRP
jgi:dTDP-glucose pyrophosphorylase